MSIRHPLVEQPDGTLVTYNYRMQAPNPASPLSSDVYRISEFFIATDQKLFDIEQKLSSSATRASLHQEYQIIGIL